MEFSKELYPTFEEAREATVEHPEVTEALEDFLTTIDRWEAGKVHEEAIISLAARIEFIFNREKNRAKECGDEDSHAEYLGAS
jgi:hypothetical protein